MGNHKYTNYRDVMKVHVTNNGGLRCKLSCGHTRTIMPQEKKPLRLSCATCRLIKQRMTILLDSMSEKGE